MRHRGTIQLESERLLLRRYTPEDAGAMYDNWASDGEVTRYLTWSPHASREATRQLLSAWEKAYAGDDVYHWALEIKATGELIGDISVVRLDETILEAELGWCMGRRWWGRGLMPEAGREVLRFLFEEVGANRVSAKHDVENQKSGRVMQKLGMAFEGVRRQGFRGNRGLVDVACYAILKSDFEA